MAETRRRVAVLLGQADEEYQRLFLKGFTEHGWGHDLDICVFAMYKEYQNSVEREKGDSSIFGIVNFSLFEAVIVLADTIQTDGLLRRLEERLRREFKGKILFVDGESKYYDELWTDSTRPMKKLVQHLYEDCGYRDFVFLNGKKWHRHSKERLGAFLDALSSYGVTIGQDIVYDGDFWYSSGNACARKLKERETKMPDVVVCANDMMAIGLCEELTKMGYSIPGDIAVTGFDSAYEGRRSPLSITSAYLSAEECGKYAAGTIYRLIVGEEIATQYEEETRLYYGETTRVKEGVRIKMEIPDKRKTWVTTDSAMGYLSVHNTFDVDIIGTSDLQQFLDTIFDYLSQMNHIRRFHLFLSTKWLEPDIFADLTFRSGALTDQVLHVLDYNGDSMSDSRIGFNERIRVADILPEVIDEPEEPYAFYLTPLFYNDKVFGYAAVSFRGTEEAFDLEYAMWMSAMMRGFEVLLRTMELKDDRARINEEENGQSGDNRSRKVRELTKDEKKEYRETMKILQDNLFHYFFQPIVDASTGEIYAYEALMRADSALSIPPLSIIRYAEMADRLDEVERATFLNVLEVVGGNELFSDRKVFINSIPGTHLEEEDQQKIDELMRKRSPNVVVEFTEQSELDDEALRALKDRYRALGAGVALDDYGTGYSNVSNLLRYMPDIVKIDRSLLSNIEDSLQKQHFVREIIDFCHENGIKALAEGVETAEELRMVIRFGADLIQGYYTGRPSPDVPVSIDDDIRREIRRFQQERQDGTDQSIYVAGKTNRVLLSSLVSEGVTSILIGHGRMTYRDITLIGIPGQQTDIHVEIAGGYEGTLTLENVSLSNIKNRPSVDIAERSRATLILEGDNTLVGGGIRVTEDSSLRMEGEGNLLIRLDHVGYYGIGAGLNEKHGKLSLAQIGEIKIDATGRNGVAIGSGLGGVIRLHHGRVRITQAGKYGVAIGSFEGNEELSVHGCDVAIDTTLSDGVCLGSMNGNASVDVERTLIKCYTTAKTMAAFGTITGEKARINIYDANVSLDMKADHSTCMGALSGETELTVDHGGVRIISDGEEALAFGGDDDRSTIDFIMADIKVDLRTGTDTDTHAKARNIRIIDGRTRFQVNGRNIERAVLL